MERETAKATGLLGFIRCPPPWHIYTQLLCPGTCAEQEGEAGGGGVLYPLAQVGGNDL